MDKKKLAILIASVVAGLIAVVLTSEYIGKSVKQKTEEYVSSAQNKEVQELKGRLAQMQQQLQDVARQSAAAAQTAQQKTSALTSATSLALKMPAGKRAITILVDRLSAVGGMVSAGDFVDILAHLTIGADAKDLQGADTITVTLFQNVQILDAGSGTSLGAGLDVQQKSAIMPITLALSPQEAGLISFAQKHGTLQLVLRPALDTQAYILPTANWQTLSEHILATQGKDIGAETQNDIPEEKPIIQIFRGGTSTP